MGGIKLINQQNRKWWILAAMGGVIGVILLDETVVGVALPTITRDLGLSAVAGHWVINAYLLVLAGLAAAGGKLGDVIGLKTVFVAGISIFALASLASGFAQSGGWLIGARAIQGIGAAVIFPLSMAFISSVFPESQRGIAIGIYGTIGTVFLTLGPLVGGLFTHFLSWRWIFWVNPPIALVIVAVVWAAWSDPPRQSAPARFDSWGLVTLIAGLGLLIFGIMQAPDWGWSDPLVWSTLAAGVVLLALFVVTELRVPLPLIQVELFRGASFTACNLVVFLGQYTKIAIIVMGALYFQNRLMMSPLEAGAALVVAVAAQPFLGVPFGWLVDRVGGRKPALVALVLTSAAFLWIGLAVGWQSYGLLVPALVVWGIAQPLLFLPALRGVMNAVPLEHQGQAGGIAMTSQLLGGTLGMAVCGTLLAVTGDYRAVFLVTGGLAVVVLAIAWFTFERAPIGERRGR